MGKTVALFYIQRSHLGSLMVIQPYENLLGGKQVSAGIICELIY